MGSTSRRRPVVRERPATPPRDDHDEALSTGRFVARLASLEQAEVPRPPIARPWLGGLVLAGVLLATAGVFGDPLAAGAGVLLLCGCVCVRFAPALGRAGRGGQPTASAVAAPAPAPRLAPVALRERATVLAAGEGCAAIVVRLPRADLADPDRLKERVAGAPVALHGWSAGVDLVLLASPGDLDDHAPALAFHFGEGSTGAPLGIAVGPEDGDTGAILVARARDAAHATQGVGWHDARTRAEVQVRTALRRDVRRGLPASEVGCAWLPVVDPRTLRVTGAEALARWDSPRHGTVLPERFLPGLAGRGASLDLAAHVLGEALARAADWGRAVPAFVVGVNVTGQELRDPRFLRMAAHLLDHHDVRPERVLLEVARDEVDSADLALLDGMRALADLGLRLVLDRVSVRDDLGAARDLPISVVKVDVRPTAGEGEAWLRRRLAAFAEDVDALGLEVRASGVASLAQLAAVCDVLPVRSVQGFALSPPVRRDGVDALLAAGRVVRLDDVARAYRFLA